MTRAPEHSRVAVLGASPKEDRYSFKAVHMLKEHGHIPVPVHPKGHVVDGIEACKSLSDVVPPIDTLTMYVNAQISSDEYDRIIKMNPRRVVFNPGAENSELAKRLRDAGIETIEACTLVMLQTEQF